MVALVVGFIFNGQQLNQDGVMNINGAIFLFLTNMTFQNVFSVANVSKKMRLINVQTNQQIFRRFSVQSYLYS